MKKICIVGASSGIGQELACEYKEEGYQVDFTVRNNKQKKQLQKKFPTSHIYVADIGVVSEISLLAEDISRDSYDIIIFSAGVGYYKVFEDATKDNIIEQFCVNTIAPTTLLQQYFKSHNYENTKFVYLTSILENIPAKNMSVYGASKKATTKTLLTYKLESPNVKILIVQLGAVQTLMHIKSGLGKTVGKNLSVTIKKLKHTIDIREGVTTLYFDWLIMIWIIFPLYTLYLHIKNIGNKYL